ncbi:hypothetical protein ABEV00_00155 [Paenibacillus thiaminolyticus]|uniref:hypothetical protein n=1 Tax=Paenibacillus thiaminolyticus TaxID=49283 RepID=UPI003D29D0B5
MRQVYEKGSPGGSLSIMKFLLFYSIFGGQMVNLGKILQNYINSLRKVPIKRLWREIGAHLQDSLASRKAPMRKL